MTSYLEDCVESLRIASEQLDHARGALLAYREQGHGLDQKVVEEIDRERDVVDVLIADATKARCEPGWEPEVGFDGLVKMMVETDYVRQRVGNGSAERVGAVEVERADSYERTPVPTAGALAHELGAPGHPAPSQTPVRAPR